MDLESLKSRSIYIATPVHAGCAVNYVNSLVAFTSLCQSLGVRCVSAVIEGHSLVQRARNRLAAMFLASECTDLLWWDSDVGVTDAESLIDMVSRPEPILGAPHALKYTSWEAIKAVVQQHPDIPASDIPLMLSSPDFVTRGGIEDVDFAPENIQGPRSLNDPIEIYRASTGLLRVRREVFEKIIASGLILGFAPTPNEFPEDIKVDWIWDFHPCGTRKVATCNGKETTAFISEDYSFCDLGRQVGYKIWTAPWVQTVHTGTFKWPCDLRVYPRYPVFG